MVDFPEHSQLTELTKSISGICEEVGRGWSSWVRGKSVLSGEELVLLLLVGPAASSSVSFGGNVRVSSLDAWHSTAWMAPSIPASRLVYS